MIRSSNPHLPRWFVRKGGSKSNIHDALSCTIGFLPRPVWFQGMATPEISEDLEHSHWSFLRVFLQNDSIGNDEEPNIFKEGCVFIRSWNHLKSVFFSQKIKDGSGFLVAERTAEFTNAPCDLVETDFGKSDWMGSPTFATLDPRMKLLWLEKNHREHVGNVTCSGWFPVSQIIVQPIFQYEWLIWQLVQRPFLIQSVLGLLVSFPLKFTPTGTTSEPRLGCEAQVVYLYEWGKNLSLGIGIGKKKV